MLPTFLRSLHQKNPFKISRVEPQDSEDSLSITCLSCLSTRTNGSWIAKYPNKLELYSWSVRLNSRLQPQVTGSFDDAPLPHIESGPLVNRLSARYVTSEKTLYKLCGAPSIQGVPDFVAAGFAEGFPDNWKEIFEKWGDIVLRDDVNETPSVAAPNKSYVSKGSTIFASKRDVSTLASSSCALSMLSSCEEEEVDSSYQLSVVGTQLKGKMDQKQKKGPQQGPSREGEANTKNMCDVQVHYASQRTLCNGDVSTDELSSEKSVSSARVRRKNAGKNGRFDFNYVGTPNSLKKAVQCGSREETQRVSKANVNKSVRDSVPFRPVNNVFATSTPDSSSTKVCERSFAMPDLSAIKDYASSTMISGKSRGQDWAQSATGSEISSTSMGRRLSPRVKLRRMNMTKKRLMVRTATVHNLQKWRPIVTCEREPQLKIQGHLVLKSGTVCPQILTTNPVKSWEELNMILTTDGKLYLLVGDLYDPNNDVRETVKATLAKSQAVDWRELFKEELAQASEITEKTVWRHLAPPPVTRDACVTRTGRVSRPPPPFWLNKTDWGPDYDAYSGQEPNNSSDSNNSSDPKTTNSNSKYSSDDSSKENARSMNDSAKKTQKRKNVSVESKKNSQEDTVLQHSNPSVGRLSKQTKHSTSSTQSLLKTDTVHGSHLLSTPANSSKTVPRLKEKRHHSQPSYRVVSFHSPPSSSSSSSSSPLFSPKTPRFHSVATPKTGSHSLPQQRRSTPSRNLTRHSLSAASSMSDLSDSSISARSGRIRKHRLCYDCDSHSCSSSLNRSVSPKSKSLHAKSLFVKRPASEETLVAAKRVRHNNPLQLKERNKPSAFPTKSLQSHQHTSKAHVSQIKTPSSQGSSPSLGRLNVSSASSGRLSVSSASSGRLNVSSASSGRLNVSSRGRTLIPKKMFHDEEYFSSGRQASPRHTASNVSPLRKSRAKTKPTSSSRNRRDTSSSCDESTDSSQDSSPSSKKKALLTVFQPRTQLKSRYLSPKIERADKSESPKKQAAQSTSAQHKRVTMKDEPSSAKNESAKPSMQKPTIAKTVPSQPSPSTTKLQARRTRSKTYNGSSSDLTEHATAKTKNVQVVERRHQMHTRSYDRKLRSMQPKDNSCSPCKIVSNSTTKSKPQAGRKLFNKGSLCSNQEEKRGSEGSASSTKEPSDGKTGNRSSAASKSNPSSNVKTQAGRHVSGKEAADSGFSSSTKPGRSFSSGEETPVKSTYQPRPRPNKGQRFLNLSSSEDDFYYPMVQQKGQSKSPNKSASKEKPAPKSRETQKKNVKAGTKKVPPQRNKVATKSNAKASKIVSSEGSAAKADQSSSKMLPPPSPARQNLLERGRAKQEPRKQAQKQVHTRGIHLGELGGHSPKKYADSDCESVRSQDTASSVGPSVSFLFPQTQDTESLLARAPRTLKERRARDLHLEKMKRIVEKKFKNSDDIFQDFTPLPFVPFGLEDFNYRKLLETRQKRDGSSTPPNVLDDGFGKEEVASSVATPCLLTKPPDKKVIQRYIQRQRQMNTKPRRQRSKSAGEGTSGRAKRDTSPLDYRNIFRDPSPASDTCSLSFAEENDGSDSD